jgi:ribosome biogenesis GTPase
MQGIITKGISGFYYVKTQEDMYECKALGKFRHDELTPLVGDNVEITLDNKRGRIEKIYPRSNALIRPSVANVSQVFIVFTIKNPDINYELLNKFLVISEYNSLKITICINKIDLLEDYTKNKINDMLIGTDYNIIFLNAKEGIGIDTLRQRLDSNITVFCGPSGVGKSTILNKLINEEKMETGLLSEKVNRGKHTTRHSELIEINGGFIVDTPGFTSLDLDFLDRDEIQLYFPEFEDYINNCKFTGCLHHKEPNCAIKDAVAAGKISTERYDFYLSCLENTFKYNYPRRYKK